jgi:hypothetical protein
VPVGGFEYSFDIPAIYDQLGLKLKGQQLEDVQTAIALLLDRDYTLTNFLSRLLAGEVNSELVSAVTGGATVTFSKRFKVPPVVVACIGDDASGATCNIVNDEVTETGFDVQFYDAAGAEQNGVPFRLNWIAV